MIQEQIAYLKQQIEYTTEANRFFAFDQPAAAAGEVQQTISLAATNTFVRTEYLTSLTPVEYWNTNCTEL